jgi:hypothetical protein
VRAARTMSNKRGGLMKKVMMMMMILLGVPVCFGMTQFVRKQARSGVKPFTQKLQKHMQVSKRRFTDSPKRVTEKQLAQESMYQLIWGKGFYEKYIDNILELNSYSKEQIEDAKRNLQPFWYDALFPYFKNSRIQRAKRVLAEHEADLQELREKETIAAENLNKIYRELDLRAKGELEDL